MKKAFQISSAPSTTGTGSKTLTQLAGPFGLFHADKIDHFSSGNMKAQANRIVRVHLHLSELNVTN